jgi:hypothetical protein
MMKRTLAGFGATCVLVLMQSAAARAQGSDIVLYAADATSLSGHWTRVADATAAGGQRLNTPDIGGAAASTPLAAPTHFVDFAFTASANVGYRVWLRLKAGANSKFNDSLFLQFSDAIDATGGPLYRTGTTNALLVNLQSCDGCALSGWGWLNGAYWFQQTTTVRFATAGARTLRLQTREDGVQVDQIVLSPSTYGSQPPGPIVNDQTIVPKAGASTPFTGARLAVPGTVQAEHFDNGPAGSAYFDQTAGNAGGAYRQTNVDIEVASDGGYNVGWIGAGEWLAYSVDVAASGTHLLEARVASYGQGGTFHVEFDGTNVTGAITVPNTGGWQTWTTVSKTVTLGAGPKLMKVVFDTAGTYAVGNVSWFRLTSAAGSGGPFTGTPIALPGTVRATDFDNGGEAVAYHDTTAGNSGGQYRNTSVDIERSSLGGYNVGWIADGEWLAYTVDVASAGSYLIRAQVASPAAVGRLHFRFGATDTAVVSVPNTGSWQTWTTVEVAANLSAGSQTMRLAADTGGFNVAAVTVSSASTPSAPQSPPPPTTTNTIVVPAGGNLQAALNAAVPGDTILLQAGATFTGNFVLPAKPGGSTSYITIRSSAGDASLPPANTRMTPAYAAHLPKIKSPNGAPALATQAGAHHYRLMFLEFPSTYQGANGIITLGTASATQYSLAQVPYELILDRVYVHGDPVYGQRFGIALHSASTSVINSYVSEIKVSGQDSQAIGGMNGPGPFTIENNYLEASGENIMFGGGDPAIPNLVPSDIVIRRNHLSKPLSWRGSIWTVKNLFELKNAQRVIVDGNLMEHNWVAAQSGYAIVLTPRNQGGRCPWCVVQDVQITNNIVRHAASGINLLGRDYTYPSQATNNIVIRNNLFENISGAQFGGGGRFLMLSGRDAHDITVDHNTVLQDGMSVVYVGQPVLNFVFTNNIVPDYSWAIIGEASSPGNTTIAAFFPGSTILGNIIAGANPSRYPGGNYYPSSLAHVGFVDYRVLTGGNYRLAATSPYRGSATDGTDVGCRFDALNAAAGTAY